LIIGNNLSQAQLVGFIITLIVLGVIVGVSILAMSHRQYTTKAVLRIASIPARLRKKQPDKSTIQKGVDDLFAAWGTLWQGQWRHLTMGAFINVAFNMLILYFMFLASEVSINLWVLIAGYGHFPCFWGK